MRSETGKVFTLSWKIKNFSSCLLKNGESLQSPIIEVEKFENTKWCFELYPKGINTTVTDFISLVLIRIGSEYVNPLNGIELTRFKIEILDLEGRRLELKIYEERETFYLGDSKGFLDFIEIDKLTNCMEQWHEDTLNVRCHAYVRSYAQPPFLFKACTEIQLEKYVFNWEISMPPSEKWSKKIVHSFREVNTFDVALKSSGSKLFLKIGVAKEQQLPEQCKLKLSISNKEKSDNNLKNKFFLLKLSDFETSFEKREVCDITNLNSYTLFKLTCTILIGNGTSTSSFECCSYENTPTLTQFVSPTTPVNAICSVGDEIQKLTHRTLQDDFKDLFQNKKHCDVGVRLVNETILTHKCLLAARSPVFATMFDQEMVESQTGIVDVVDCETETLRLFLEFLYTDTITNTDCEEVLKLMFVADKYQVSLLKVKCSEILMSKISLDNVCEVISVADMVNQLDLKLFALDYIKANKKIVISSCIWSDWVKKNIVLGMEILTKISIG